MTTGNTPLDEKVINEITGYVHGIRPNIGQFAQQLLQVFFVGMTIGMQRTVVPALAESEFGVPAGSFILLMAFVVSFGFVKGGMNFFSGCISEKVGRRKVLIWGWLIALPIVIGMWICAVGIGATLSVDGMVGWSMTAAVTGVGMALLYPTLIATVGDISHPDWRGSSLGVYRFWRGIGYGIGALSLGVIADAFGTLDSGLPQLQCYCRVCGIPFYFA